MQGGSVGGPDVQEVVKAVFELGDMVRRADWGAMHDLVESLPINILVEVVMANMAYLPSREAVFSSQVRRRPHPPPAPRPFLPFRGPRQPQPCVPLYASIVGASSA